VNRRDALAEDLRALADDLKRLYETATTDPKELKWRERRWRVLESAVGVVMTLAVKRLLIKAWGILTGEEAPKRPPTEAPHGEVQAGQPVPEQAAPAPPPPEQQPWPGQPSEAEFPSMPQPERPVGAPFTAQPQAESEAETMPSSSSSVK
jgi:hypothetical protein